MTWKIARWPALAISCILFVAVAGCGGDERPAAASTSSAAAPASAVEMMRAEPRVLPPHARPYGATYGKWAAHWWTWLLAQPADVNPNLDTTGEHCAVGQSGHVWFLAGTFGDPPVERRCTIPAGRALLFPVLNGAYFAFLDDPPETRTVKFIRSQVAWVKDATDLFAVIDGKQVDDVERWLEKSPIFRIVLPEGNIFGLPAGFVLDPCVDAGYYLAVPPLPPGAHEIRFGGTSGTLKVDVTYHLTVARPTR
jgi:hypothetical protein